MGLFEVSDDVWCRHPLSYLVEAADDICYALMDIEDGIELGLLRISDIRKILNRIIDIPDVRESPLPPAAARRKVYDLRGKVMQKLIDGVVKAFEEKYDLIMDGKLKGDILDYCDRNVRFVVKQSKTFAKSRIFSHRRKVHIEIGVYSTIDILLSAFCNSAQDFVKCGGVDEKLSFKTKRIVEYIRDEGADIPEDLYNCYLYINDFVSGMTDNYATFVSRQISGFAV